MQSKFHLVPACFSLLNNTIRDIIKLMSLRADFCACSGVESTPESCLPLVKLPNKTSSAPNQVGKNPNLYKKFFGFPARGGKIYAQNFGISKTKNYETKHKAFFLISIP